jgi:hypothetical protein
MATFDADRYVLGFEEIDRAQTAVVGGKGANLGELSRIAGIRVRMMNRNSISTSYSPWARAAQRHPTVRKSVPLE